MGGGGDAGEEGRGQKKRVSRRPPEKRTAFPAPVALPQGQAFSRLQVSRGVLVPENRPLAMERDLEDPEPGEERKEEEEAEENAPAGDPMLAGARARAAGDIAHRCSIS